MLPAQLDQMFECVGAAVDARTAVDLVVAERPDVVILGVNMPGGGAMHATREIHKQSPDTAIVVLSIDEAQADMSELLRAGAMTYLRTGLDERALSRSLAAAIEGHRRNLQSVKPGSSD
jgi:DNA-binding NarL/FixJ family response regulator